MAVRKQDRVVGDQSLFVTGIELQARRVVQADHIELLERLGGEDRLDGGLR